MKTATETKSRPIIFGAESVKAILEGRKTMTRRILKPQPQGVVDFAQDSATAYYDGSFKQCSYGKVGDRLFVRETWSESFKRNPETKQLYVDHYIYKADMVDRSLDGVFVHFAPGADKSKFKTMADLHKWRSPIHMPRWASRIELEITNIRVERLMDITVRDVVREGFPNLMTEEAHLPHFEQFEKAWNKMHGENSFNQSPWVWVIEFKKL